MTVIKLGSVSLHVGMTLEQAQKNDEKMKAANHGKELVDKEGNALPTTVSVFNKYDKNKDGVISNEEYDVYKADQQRFADEMFKKLSEGLENKAFAPKEVRNEDPALKNSRKSPIDEILEEFGIKEKSTEKTYHIL